MTDVGVGREQPQDHDAIRDAALASLRAKRTFQAHLLKALVLVPVLVAIWAITEYHNAGGWPTAFATGRRNRDWDPWIIYPLVAVGAYLGVSGWLAYRRRPITERDIDREMERLSGSR
jgi:H+/Cl- antiporter ClcA